MSHKARAVASILVAVALFMVVTACSKGGTSPSGTSATPTVITGTSTGSATGTGSAVTATETEYSIVLSTTTLTAGSYTFTIKNQGKMPHNLNVKGPGIGGQASPTVSPGASAQLTVTLQQGSYELWCSIDGHKDLGMDLTVQVG